MLIFAQVIGIVAMIINILSFQCKKNRNLFIMIGMILTKHIGFVL